MDPMAPDVQRLVRPINPSENQPASVAEALESLRGELSERMSHLRVRRRLGQSTISARHRVRALVGKVDVRLLGLKVGVLLTLPVVAHATNERSSRATPWRMHDVSGDSGSPTLG